MDEHRVADHRHRRVRVHQSDVDVHQLGRVVRDHRRAEELIGVCVGDELDEAVGFADLHRLRIAPDFEARHFDLLPALPRLPLGHSHPSDFGIGEDRVGDDPLRRPRAVPCEL